MTEQWEIQSHHARALLTCKHFNGIFGLNGGDGVCRAGITYRTHVGGSALGWITRLPCLPRPVGEAREVVPCDRREFPTEADVEVEEARVKNIMASTAEAIALVRADAAGRRGIDGTVSCPVCDRELIYVVSKFNDHTRGRCTTENCLTWIE